MASRRWAPRKPGDAGTDGKASEIGDVAAHSAVVVADKDRAVAVTPEQLSDVEWVDKVDTRRVQSALARMAATVPSAPPMAMLETAEDKDKKQAWANDTFLWLHAVQQQLDAAGELVKSKINALKPLIVSDVRTDDKQPYRSALGRICEKERTVKAASKFELTDDMFARFCPDEKLQETLRTHADRGRMPIRQKLLFAVMGKVKGQLVWDKASAETRGERKETYMFIEPVLPAVGTTLPKLEAPAGDMAAATGAVAVKIERKASVSPQQQQQHKRKRDDPDEDDDNGGVGVTAKQLAAEADLSHAKRMINRAFLAAPTVKPEPSVQPPTKRQRIEPVASSGAGSGSGSSSSRSGRAGGAGDDAVAMDTYDSGEILDELE